MKYSFLLTLIVYSVTILVIMLIQTVKSFFDNTLDVKELSFTYDNLIFLFICIFLVIHILGNFILSLFIHNTDDITNNNTEDNSNTINNKND